MVWRAWQEQYYYLQNTYFMICSINSLHNFVYNMPKEFIIKSLYITDYYRYIMDDSSLHFRDGKWIRGAEVITWLRTHNEIWHLLLISLDVLQLKVMLLDKRLLKFSLHLFLEPPKRFKISFGTVIMLAASSWFSSTKVYRLAQNVQQLWMFTFETECLSADDYD